MQRRGPFLLLGVATIELIVAIVAVVLSGLRLGEAVDGYVLTNAAMGTTFALCGAVVARSAPGNPIGWLFLGFAVAHLTTAALVPVSALTGGGPVIDTIAFAAWPFGIGMCLPLALQLFPTGRPVSPRWRPLLWFTVLAGFGFAGGFATEVLIGPNPILNFTNPLVLVSFLGTLAGLVVRYRRGDDELRRRLLWLVLAALGMLVINAPRFVFGDGPILPLLAVNLIPVAVTVAIVRYGLYDVRLIVSRTVLYLALSAAVAGVYALLLVVLDRLVGGPVLATLLIALAFNPARVWLQRRVDRLFYGDRRDPMRLVSEVGSRLTEAGLDGVVGSVRDALRLPYAEIRGPNGPPIAPGVYRVPLTYQGEAIGELVAGPRAGQRQLSSADRAALHLLGAPLAAAVRAATLRERLVAATAEERRRMHNELHDRLGPALTGAAFKADAIGNLAATDPARVRAYSAELSAQIREAIDDVRRLVYDLRPPVLDELGLIGAVRREAARLASGGHRIEVEAPESLPELPAAVEVAAYRIATEALTNSVRHATATRSTVCLRLVEGELRVTVTDDGSVRTPWQPGVGLRSAAERATEVGGTCTAGPTPAGGRLAAALPVVAR